MFCCILNQDYFSNNANADKISKVKEQVDEVQQIMVQNIERVLERGERLELLVVLHRTHKRVHAHTHKPAPTC